MERFRLSLIRSLEDEDQYIYELHRRRHGLQSRNHGSNPSIDIQIELELESIRTVRSIIRLKDNGALQCCLEAPGIPEYGDLMTAPLRFIEEATKNAGKSNKNDDCMVSDNVDGDSLSASTANNPDNVGTQLELAEDEDVDRLLPSRSKGNMDEVTEGGGNYKINENDAASDANSVSYCLDKDIMAPQTESKEDQKSITETIQVIPVIPDLMMASAVSVDYTVTTDAITKMKPNSETTVSGDDMIAVTSDAKSQDNDVTHPPEIYSSEDSSDSTSKSHELSDDKIQEVIIRHTDNQSTMDLQEKDRSLDSDSSDNAEDTKMNIDETPLADAVSISAPLSSMTTEPLAVKSTEDGCKLVEITDNTSVDTKTIDEPNISPPEVQKSIDRPGESGLLSTVVSRKAGDEHSEFLSLDSVSISKGKDEPIIDPVVSSSKILSDIDDPGIIHQLTDHVETMTTTGNDDKQLANDTTIVSPLDSDDHRKSIDDVLTPMSPLSNTNAMISPVSSTDEETIHSDVNHISDEDTDVHERDVTLPNNDVMDENKDAFVTDLPISDAETPVVSHTVSMDATLANSIPLDEPEHIQDSMRETSISRVEIPVEGNTVTEITVLNNNSKLFCESVSTLDTVGSSEQENLSPTIALSSSTTSTDRGDKNELEYTLDSAKTVSLEEVKDTFETANTFATDSCVNRPEIIPRSTLSVALDDDDSSNKPDSTIFNDEHTEETMDIKKLSSSDSDNAVNVSLPYEKVLHSEGDIDHPEPMKSLATVKSSAFDGFDSNVRIPPSTCTASDVSSPVNTETMMSTQMENLSVIKSDEEEIVHEVAEAHPDELKEANNEIIHESPQPLDSELIRTTVTNTLDADSHLDVELASRQSSKSVDECDPCVNSKEIISPSDASDSGCEKQHSAEHNATDGYDNTVVSSVEPTTSESHRENATCEPAAIENDGSDTAVPLITKALPTHTASLETKEETNDDMKNISIDENVTDNMKIRSLSDTDEDSTEPGVNTTSVEDSTINNPLPEYSEGEFVMETSLHQPQELEHSTSNNLSNETAESMVAELSVPSNTTLESVDGVMSVDANEKTQSSDETEMNRSESTAMVGKSLESMNDGSIDNPCTSDNTVGGDDSKADTATASTILVNSNNDTMENVALASVNEDTDSIPDSGISSTLDAGGLPNEVLKGGDAVPSTVSNDDMDTSVVPSSEVSTPSVASQADLVDASPIDAIEDDSHTDLPLAHGSTGLSLEQTEMRDSTPDSALEESTPLAIHTPTNGGNQNELISSPGISDDSSSVVALSNDGSLTPLESRHVSLTPQSDVSYINAGSMGDGTPSSDDSFPSSDMLESDASVVRDMRQMVDISEISSDHSIEDDVNIGEEHENYTTQTPDLSGMSDYSGSPVASDHIPIDSSDEHSTLEDTALKDEDVPLNAEPLKTIKSATRSDTNGTTSSDASSAVLHDDSVNDDGSSQTYTSYIMSLF